MADAKNTLAESLKTISNGVKKNTEAINKNHDELKQLLVALESKITAVTVRAKVGGKAAQPKQHVPTGSKGFPSKPVWIAQKYRNPDALAKNVKIAALIKTAKTDAAKKDGYKAANADRKKDFEIAQLIKLIQDNDAIDKFVNQEYEKAKKTPAKPAAVKKDDAEEDVEENTAEKDVEKDDAEKDDAEKDDAEKDDAEKDDAEKDDAEKDDAEKDAEDDDDKKSKKVAKKKDDDDEF
jgi:hypothetical protein